MDLPLLHDALTQGGNLKTAVHKNIKNQFGEKLEGLGLTKTPNGDFAMKVADASGKTVFVRVEAVVTLKDPFIAKDKKVRKKKVSEIPDVPALF